MAEYLYRKGVRDATPFCKFDSTVNSEKYCDTKNTYFFNGLCLYLNWWRVLVTIPWPAASPDLSPIENMIINDD